MKPLSISINSIFKNRNCCLKLFIEDTGILNLDSASAFLCCDITGELNEFGQKTSESYCEISFDLGYFGRNHTLRTAALGCSLQWFKWALVPASQH